MTAQRSSFLIVLITVLLAISTVWVIAQDDATCGASLETLYTLASDACIDSGQGTICNGGSAPGAEPAGAVSNSLAPLGSLLQVDLVDAIRPPGIDASGRSGGLVWMRVVETNMSALLLGDVTMRDQSSADEAAWSAFTVQTDETHSDCVMAPRNALVLQNGLRGSFTRITINGTVISLRGTALIQTRDSETIFATLEGELQVMAQDQIERMVAGQQVIVQNVPGDPTQVASQPTIPLPFEPYLVENLPVALLDRPIQLPQPGYVQNPANINLRAGPSVDTQILSEIGAGQLMTILGRNPSGEWYHVRLANGQTGWMFAELLERRHGAIEAVYDQTPVPPQRYGETGEVAYITSPSGAILRAEPYSNANQVGVLPAGAEVRLLARSPYLPWVLVQSGDGSMGWISLINVQTRVFIEALPVDFDVPAPTAQPTLVILATAPPIDSGGWGNAFPDPDCYPNCGP